MVGRPEGNDGGYGWIQEPHDPDAWQEFTPWRPGDEPAREQGPAQSTAKEADNEGRRRWSEPQPERFYVGDRVRSTRPVGGVFGGAVPAGSFGEVVSTRVGLFDEFVTVRFENGYTEEIRPDLIKREGWF